MNNKLKKIIIVFVLIGLCATIYLLYLTSQHEKRASVHVSANQTLSNKVQSVFDKLNTNRSNSLAIEAEITTISESEGHEMDL